MLRLAIIVSHPIQYYTPLYRYLAQRGDVEIKVFYTWHGADKPVLDQGFTQAVAWDIPLTMGYEFEVVPNVARKPGTHHFFGLQNPTLHKTVLRWKPDVVFLFGYAYDSHLKILHFLYRRRIPVLLRGDSHLLNQKAGFRWLLKQIFLRRVYRWPSSCLYVGTHNRSYFRTFAVPEHKLFPCPHSIEVERFAKPHEELEVQASVWRREIGVREDCPILLFAGKFEEKKRPVALMQAVLEHGAPNLVLVMVGNGELSGEVQRIAQLAPNRFRILPFQNQSRMPLVYRLGDIVVLPSAYGETWGLAINEALACGRPVLVSDKVGCAPDLVKSGITGEVFRSDDWGHFRDRLTVVVEFASNVDRSQLIRFSRQFDISVTADHLIAAVSAVTKQTLKTTQKPLVELSTGFPPVD